LHDINDSKYITKLKVFAHIWIIYKNIIKHIIYKNIIIIYKNIIKHWVYDFEAFKGNK